MDVNPTRMSPVAINGNHEQHLRDFVIFVPQHPDRDKRKKKQDHIAGQRVVYFVYYVYGGINNRHGHAYERKVAC
jgi:hypothetical protein